MPNNDLIIQLNKNKGYLFCQECSDYTNGNWDVWVNPHHLCEHLQAKMSPKEIRDAIAYFDEQHERTDEVKRESEIASLRSQ